MTSNDYKEIVDYINYNQKYRVIRNSFLTFIPFNLSNRVNIAKDIVI